MRKISILILIFLLYGCEKQQQVEVAPETEVETNVDKDIWDLPEEEEEVIEEKPYKPQRMVKNEDFPDVKGLMLSRQAAELRGIRQQESWELRQESLQKMKDIEDEPKTKDIYIREDVDYSKLGLEPDVATLPVNVDRMLTSDLHIPCIVEDSINSQIAGKVRLIVDEDVLSASMKYVVLPYYTRITCTYNSLEKVGQTRLQLTCKDIIRPDRSRAIMTSTVGSDISGRTGLIGEIDNRYFEQFGASAILTVISAGAQLAGDKLSNNDGITSRVGEQLSRDWSQIGAKTIEKHLDIRPVMTIDAGTKILLRPDRDIYFPPPIKITRKEKK